MDSTFQFLSLNLPYDVPLPGELLNSEIALNISNGRMWAGTQNGIIELGDSRYKKIGPSDNFNFTYLEINSLEDFPIVIPNPSEIELNNYRAITYYIKYNADNIIVPSPSQIFTYPVVWGNWGYFDEDNLFKLNTDTSISPLNKFYSEGSSLVFTLFSFGPSLNWLGNVNWTNYVG